jgi:hypothetical protein
MLRLCKLRVGTGIKLRMAAWTYKSPYTGRTVTKQIGDTRSSQGAVCSDEDMSCGIYKKNSGLMAGVRETRVEVYMVSLL